MSCYGYTIIRLRHTTKEQRVIVVNFRQFDKQLYARDLNHFRSSARDFSRSLWFM